MLDLIIELMFASVNHDPHIITILRSLAPGQKLALARDMNRMADRLTLAGIQRRKPDAAPHELGYALALQRLAPEHYAHGAAILSGTL